MALLPAPQSGHLPLASSLLHHPWLVAVLALHSSGGRERPLALRDTGLRALLVDPDPRRWEMPVYLFYAESICPDGFYLGSWRAKIRS